jgi:predicted phage gp36 major capsid-like protein
MTEKERERVLARIVEIQQTLLKTRSPDVRDALQQAIADCQARLAQIEVRDLARSDARDQEPRLSMRNAGGLAEKQLERQRGRDSGRDQPQAARRRQPGAPSLSPWLQIAHSPTGL